MQHCGEPFCVCHYAVEVGKKSTTCFVKVKKMGIGEHTPTAYFPLNAEFVEEAL